MAAPRYSSSGIRSSQRGLSIVQCVFALSVITGLMFVTFRITSMGVPTAMSQPAQTDAAQVTAETAPPAPDGSDTKTP